MGYAYPVDSILTYIAGEPQYDRAVSSETLRSLYAAMMTNGIILRDSTNLQVVEDEGLKLKVKSGFCLMNGCMKKFDKDTSIELAAAEATRVDTIVARLNLNQEVRDITIEVIQGTGTEPPALVREGDIYDLGLANVTVNVGAVTIAQADINDTRLDTERCGIISSISEFDTKTLYDQMNDSFYTWFESIKGQLSDDVAGGLQMQIEGLADDIDTLQDDVETVEDKVEVLENTLGYTASKNLLENTGTTTTKSGVTFTVNDDKSITLNGTATANTSINVRVNFYLPNGEYILSGCPKDGTINTYYLHMSGEGINCYDFGQGGTFVVNDGMISYVRIFINSGATVDNLTFYPMIRKADVTDDTYEPYGKRDVDIRLNSVETNKADLDLSNVINSVFLSKAVNSGLGQVEVKSHVGTGTGSATSSNIKPVSITFSFAPKVVIYIGNQNSNGFYSTLGITGNNIMISSILTTEYKNFVGFKGGSTGTSNGKKSSDGKTFYWYTIDGSSSPSLQLNSSGFTYYFLAIG